MNNRAQAPLTKARAARPFAGSANEAGFTLIELVVSLFVLVLILVGVLYLFDLNSRLARVETNVAEMQQSLRIGQYDLVRVARMAGRGGLPYYVPGPVPLPSGGTFPGKLLPHGVAVEVANNVNSGTAGADTLNGIDNSGGPTIVKGTDVLTLRGVFSGPVYSLDPINAAAFNPPPAGGGNGNITIQPVSPTGVPQDLTSLNDAIADAAAGQQPAIIIVSPLGQYAIGAIQGGSTAGTSTTPAIVNFTVSTSTGSGPAADYAKLMAGGTYPTVMKTAAFAGVLQEYKYYIRAEHSVPGDSASPIMPVLSRAEFYPNTSTPVGGKIANLAEDIADNVPDLQVAFGVDVNNDGIIEDQTTNPTLTTATDEWLLNNSGDQTSSIPWNPPPVPGAPPEPLLYLRITTLAETARRDPNYISPAIQSLEDSPNYPEATNPTGTAREDRMFRRRQLTTVVSLRNLQ